MMLRNNEVRLVTYKSSHCQFPVAGRDRGQQKTTRHLGRVPHSPSLAEICSCENLTVDEGPFEYPGSRNGVHLSRIGLSILRGFCLARRRYASFRISG